MEATSVHELRQDVSQQFQLQAERKNIRLCIQLDPGNVLTVGDIGLIQSVLENLVKRILDLHDSQVTVTSKN